jgi:uncharacterized membrane protein (UPF0182 family)
MSDIDPGSTLVTGVVSRDVTSVVRRLAFAWRYRDVNLLISGMIREDSRLLMNM